MPTDAEIEAELWAMEFEGLVRPIRAPSGDVIEWELTEAGWARAEAAKATKQ